jgi:thiol-disulfide isomerase/thioredoxin
MNPRTRTIILGISLLVIVGIIGYLQSTKTGIPNLPSEGNDIKIEDITSNATNTLTTPADVTPSTAETPVSPKTTPPPAKATAVKVTPPPPNVLTSKKTAFPRAKELVRPSGYSNSDNLGLINTNQFLLKDFIGKKVILVDFWTYSCINCQRTIPYLNNWYSKYKDKGLLIVGVHTPKFDFEKSKSNVDAAIAKSGIRYPVVLDNEYGTWGAYGNKNWPHKYLIDIDGFIIYDHIGEGGYEETELKIQKALTERAARLGGVTGSIAMPITTPSDAIIYDVSKVLSPETYFGAARNKNLGAGSSLKEGVQNFDPVVSPTANMLYLTGSWNFFKEYAQNMTVGTKITYNYNAKSVYFVAGAQKMIRVKVLRDGKPLDETNAGKDIRYEKGESVFYVSEERLYDIVGDKVGYGTHIIEFTVDGSGLNAFALTFG